MTSSSESSQPHETLVQSFVDAKANRALLSPPSSQGDFGFEEAYGVGEALMRSREARGHRVVGRKLGLTNKAAWGPLGLNAPVWSYIYDDTVHYLRDDTFKLPLAEFVAPKLEPEIVFGWRGGGGEARESPWDILQNVAWLALGFEIVDCHFPDWRFRPADAVADFGLHGALLVGPAVEVPSDHEALYTQLGGLKLSLRRDGVAEAQGSGEDVMGNPVAALAHLADALQGVWPLEPGEVTTTGTLTTPAPIKPGERWTAVPEGALLEPLTVSFE